MREIRIRLLLLGLVFASLSCSLITEALGVASATPADIASPETAPPPPTASETAAQAPSASPPASATTPATQVVYIPPPCQGVAVATIPPATTMAEPTLALEANPPISTVKQLILFDDLAEIISANYLYSDFNGLDWPAIAADYRLKVEGGLDTEAFYTEMTNLINELGDEHSYFLSPKAAAAAAVNLAGGASIVGIGVLIQPLIEKDRVTILAVLPDSPAEHSGLKAHDGILAVDGLPVVAEGIVYTQRVRGPECSAAVFTVQTPGEAPRQITIVRQRIAAPLPIDARLAPTSDGARIGYIFIPTFFDTTVPAQVRAALESFGPLDGLILDNRMNGGGSSLVVDPLFAFFTSGVLGDFVSRTESRPLEIAADPIHNSQTVPIVVLVGEDTVSFGEIFSGVLQALGRAKVVGETTGGNVETLNGYIFDNGAELWLAEERFDPAHSEADWEITGIQPDREVIADWDTFTFENDPAVAAAVKLLGH